MRPEYTNFLRLLLISLAVLSVGRVAAAGEFEAKQTGGEPVLRCGDYGGGIQHPLSLTDVIQRSLCNNPQARIANANLKIQQAQAGISSASYYPTLSLSGNLTRNNTNNTNLRS